MDYTNVWIELYSKEHGCPHWYNPLTGYNRWKYPGSKNNIPVKIKSGPEPELRPEPKQKSEKKTKKIKGGKTLNKTRKNK
jgi:hypothetical protein